MFDLRVRTLDGRDTLFEIEDESTTISTLKGDIETKLGIAASRQRLIFCGRVLGDDEVLVNCGVQGRVLHLVERPPPTQFQSQQEPVVTSVNETFGNADPLFTGFTFDNMSMQHAIQEITARILNETIDLTRGRNVNSENRSTNGAGNERSSLSLRETTFESLFRQGSRILRRLGNYMARNATNANRNMNIASVEQPYNRVEILNEIERESTVIHTDGGTQPFIDVVCQPDSASVNADRSTRHQETGQSAPISSDQSSLLILTNSIRNRNTINTSIGELPDNNLEASTEFYRLDESTGNTPMITVASQFDVSTTRESAFNVSQPQETRQTATSSSDQPSLLLLANLISRYRALWHQSEPLLNQWETMLRAEQNLQNGSNTGNITNYPVVDHIPDFSTVEVTSTENVSTEAATQVVWQQRLFRDISRFLHINAHMLHLISDFDVMLTEDSVSTYNQPSTQPEAQPVDEFSMPMSPAMEVEVTTSPITVQPIEPRPRRILYVPEQDRSWMSGRASFDFPDITISATGEAPTVITRNAPSTFVLNRNRSQSATDISHSSTDTITTSTVGIPATQQPSITTTAISSDRAAILRCISIPVLSMNMINMPSTRASRRPADTRPTFVTGGMSDFQLPNASMASGISVTSFDRFLFCNSHHFGRNISLRTPRVPASSATLDPASSQQPTVQATSGLEDSATTLITTNSHSTTTTASQFGFTFPGFGLPQQLMSLVSAAAAGVSNGLGGSFFAAGNSPFNFIVTSTPIMVTVSTTNSTSMTTTSTTNATQPRISTFDVASCTNDVQQSTPVWLSPTDSMEDSLNGLARILAVLLQGCVRTVWSRVTDMTNEMLVDENQQTIFNCQTSLQNRRILTGFITDIIRKIRDLLGQQENGAPQSTFVHSHLDNLRDYLQHLVHCVDSAIDNRFQLNSVIANLIFEGIIVYDNSLPRHSYDVEASFLKLLTDIISTQLELWRISPTNSSFGITLSLTLELACHDLLCMTDILTQALMSTFGVSLHTDQISGVRANEFGFSFSFDVLLDHLSSFELEFQDDASIGFCQLVRNAVDRCIETYCSMSADMLRLRVTRNKAFLATRSIANDSPMNIDSPIVTDDVKSNKCSSESDTEHYTDAYSVLQMNESEPARTELSPNIEDRIASLPSWRADVGEVPRDVEAALKSDSICQYTDIREDTSDWRSVLPLDWVNVVARDVAKMTDAPGEDENSIHNSDAYIAGMPAKRRRIIKDRAQTIIQSPNSLFVECLSGAIAQSTTTTISTANLTSKAECAQSCPNRIELPEPDKELVKSLCDIVSDQISSRLTTDPDFNPSQFPLANKKFGGKKNP